MHSPALHFVCHNPACVYYEIVRTVPMAPAGDGLFHRPDSVVCECSPATGLKVAITEPDGTVWDEINLTGPSGRILLAPTVAEMSEPPC